MPLRTGLLTVCSVVLLAAPTARAERLSPDWVSRWRADLAVARDSVPRQHPNFFHATAREAYRGALDSLAARVPDLEQHEIVVELARIVALVHDGHTRLTFPFDSASGFFMGHAKTATPKIPGLVFRHYPIRFGLFADTLVVVRADSSHRELLGGRVVTLGRMSAAEAMAAVEPTIHRDNENQVRDLLPTWLACPEILQARHVVADRESAPIAVEQPGGARVRGTLEPVPVGVGVRWIDARPPGLRDRFPERSHWFVRLPGTSTVYARYREVMDDRHETVAAFGDSLFAAIEASHADRLVLDLRGNVGGFGDLNRTLVLHLIRATRLWHAGGLWALIDRGTFSAAVMMAAELERWTPAILVGEMTSGHPNSYGDSRRVVLPKTGLTVRVASLFEQLTSPQDPRPGITPHVPVEATSADWRANRDPALAVALARGDLGGLAGDWSGEIGWQQSRLPARLSLARRGQGWEGRFSFPAADLDSVSVGRLQAMDERLQSRWSAAGEPWGLEVRLAGDRLVGIVRSAGVDHPFVMERTGHFK